MQESPKKNNQESTRLNSKSIAKINTIKGKPLNIPFYDDFTKNFCKKSSNKSSIKKRYSVLQSAKQLTVRNHKPIVKINKKYQNDSMCKSKISTRSTNNCNPSNIMSNSTYRKSKKNSILGRSIFKDANIREEVANLTIDKLKTQTKENQYVSNVMFDLIKKHAVYNKHFMKDINSILN